MASIDELFAQWQSGPDVTRTIALCEALREMPRPDLVDIVGRYASQQLEVPALTAAARMYVEAGRLDDAQETLVSAGRLDPRNGSVYRALGVLLLRRGDAIRAEKVLSHAAQFDPGEDATIWLKRSREFVATQASGGSERVATAVRATFFSDGGPTSSRAQKPAIRKVRTSPESVREPGSRKSVPPLSGHERGASTRAPSLSFPRTAPVFQNFSPDAGVAPAPRSSRALLPHPNGATTGTALGDHTVDPSEPTQAAASPVGRLPSAKEVLAALTLAGIFEPEGAVRPHPGAWDNAPATERPKRRLAVLAGALVVFLGASVATLQAVRHLREQRHVQAEQLLERIDANVKQGDVSLLASAESDLARVFELENRSPHAALTWAHERVAAGLLRGTENISFEDALARAKEVGVADELMAFGPVASFLFQNDTAGAAMRLATSDTKAAGDPWYALVAGATLERAGDPRALERYESAVRIDSDFVLARVFLARATAVDGEGEKAAELARALRDRFPTRPEGAGLVALAWARSPLLGASPVEVQEAIGAREALAGGPLRAIPYALSALVALENARIDEARSALQAGLSLCDTPGLSAWFGSIALRMGDETLARRAAMSAVSFSSAYAPARILAARAALLGGRLDEATKATE